VESASMTAIARVTEPTVWPAGFSPLAEEAIPGKA
jgi:hypothetical protein